MRGSSDSRPHKLQDPTETLSTENGEVWTTASGPSASLFGDALGAQALDDSPASRDEGDGLFETTPQVAFSLRRADQLFAGCEPGTAKTSPSKFKIAAAHERVGTGATSLRRPAPGWTAREHEREMALALTNRDDIRNSLMDSLFARGDLAKALPKYLFPDGESYPEDVFQVIQDELLLDGNARQNLATFCQPGKNRRSTRSWTSRSTRT